MLLLLLAMAEEFKWTPAALQHFCCWMHENNSARNLLTLTAIIINFGLASTDIVSGGLKNTATDLYTWKC